MADYTEQATWSTKDALATGQALKAISATELGNEFSAIATAIATKYDSDDMASAEEAKSLTSTSKIISPDALDDVLTDNAGIAKDLQALADPGADTIFGWDNSTTSAIAYTLGEGLRSVTTDINLDFSELSTVALASADTIPFYDVSGSANGKVTVALLEAGLQIANMADYDANDNIDHTTVSITAGTGLTGGGTIAAPLTVNVAGTAPITVAADAVEFDISGLSTLDASTLAPADIFLVDDGAGGTNKAIAWQSMGPQVVESSTKTLALTDGNAFFVNTGSVEDTITVPPNTTAFPIGTQIGFATQGTAAILLAQGAGVTINSLESYKQVKGSGGGAYLIKTGTNVWSLIGDLEA